MGWAVGYDAGWHRHIGYGVPAKCDQPGCSADIDRGLDYVCGEEVFGGEAGCGLFFCHEHLYTNHKSPATCVRCSDGEPPFSPSHDTVEWVTHQLNDESWADWRSENKTWVSWAKKFLSDSAASDATPPS